MYFSITRPSEQAIRAILATHAEVDFNYEGVGQTRAAVHPVGYAVNQRRQVIGEGPQGFEAAREAIRGWEMFAMGWVELCWPDAPIETGAVVGVLANRLGLWSLNPCRIAYTLDEDDGAVARYGFGYGTLPGHAMIGEERFLVEWDRGTDEVSYTIYAFARPKGLLSWLILPILRSFQRQFATDSIRVMQKAAERMSV